MIKIAFPEWENEIIRQAVAESEGVEMLTCENLAAGAAAVKNGLADAIVAGIDYTSREVILACRDIIGLKNTEAKQKPTFSASFWMKRDDAEYVIGDAAACKNPSEEQLYDIVLQTHATALKLLDEEPRVAVLSFSTLGSGGKDLSIEKSLHVIERVRREHPEIVIDGELQLDAAVNVKVGEKKAPNSLVAGKANVLIAPDLNSGNISYKAMEQFGKFRAAGPLLQGFMAPVSDLSRGSTVEDVKLVIEAMKKLTSDLKA